MQNKQVQKECDAEKSGAETSKPKSAPSLPYVPSAASGSKGGGAADGRPPCLVPVDCDPDSDSTSVTPAQAKEFFRQVKNSLWQSKATEARWEELVQSIDRLSGIAYDREFIKATKAEHGDDALADYVSQREAIADRFFSDLCWEAEITNAALNVLDRARKDGKINSDWLDLVELYYCMGMDASKIRKITGTSGTNQRKARQRTVEALAKYIPRDMV